MQYHKYSIISIFRLPIFWLYLGPPIFRILGERDAAASLAGSTDIWNIARILWWLFFGIIALNELYQSRAILPLFLRRLNSFPWWVGIWLITLFASTLASPAPEFTVVSASMMVILVIAALDLGVKLSSGALVVERTLKILLGFSWLLLLIFSFTFVIAPEVVGAQFGTSFPRIRGAPIADIALVSQIALFSGLYLASHRSGFKRSLYLLIGYLGIPFLLLAQTRAMYVTLLVGLLIYAWQRQRTLAPRQRIAAIGLTCLVLSGAVGVGLYEELFSKSVQVYANLENLLVRGDAESVQSLSGRDGITAVTVNAIISQPMGLGYSAGPRALLLESTNELWKYRVHAARIGNAHNMYLEVLGGSGIIGFGAWIALLVWLLYRLWMVRKPDAIPIRVLFLVVLLGGLTESSGALPFTQSSALLWIIAAFTASFKYR